MEEQGITPLDRLRTLDNFNENNPAYLRAREKFTARRDNMLYGKSFHEREYASMMKDLSGPEQAALEIEFGQTPEMRNFFSEAKQARENYDIKGGPIDLLNDGITKFSDFASMDRKDDGMFEKTVRGAANIPLWTMEGLQTAGQGFADIFTDEKRDLNRGSTFDNIVRGSGALFGGSGAAKLLQGTGKVFSGGAKGLFPGTANALGKGKDAVKNLLTTPSGKQAAKGLDDVAAANPGKINQTLNGNKMSINTGPAPVTLPKSLANPTGKGVDDVAKAGKAGDDVAKATEAAAKAAGKGPAPVTLPKSLANPTGKGADDIAKAGKAGDDIAKATEDAAKAAGKGVDDVAKGGNAAAKTGLTAKAIALAKANPKTAAAAGLIGAAGVANMFDDDPAARLDPNEKKEGDGGGAGEGDGATTLGLGSGMNPGEANATGERNAANQRDFMKPRLGGSGSSMMDLGAARQRAFADKQEDIRQDKLEGNFDPTFSQDPNYFLKQRYEATGGRGAGDWDLLTPEEKSEMAGNYRQNSYYDSSSDAGKAADAKLKESGWTAPMADPQSQAEGQAMAEQNRLQELDAAVERQKMGLNDAYGVAADPENYQGDVKAVSKEEFTDKSGMFTPGTGIIGDENTGYTTLETGDAFKGSGGRDSAEEYLIGQQKQGPILPQGQKTFGPQQNMPRPMSEPGVEQQGPVGYPTTGYSQADPLLDPNVGDIQNQPRDIVPIENGASLMAQLDNIGPGSGKAPVQTAPGQYTPASTTTTMTEPATNPFDPQNMAAPWMNRPAQYETTENPASYEAPEYEGSGKGMYTDQFGQESELSKGTVRMSADDQEHGNNFTSSEDALGYVNRGGRPSMDDPAPAPAPAPESEPGINPETGLPWGKIIGGGAALTAAALAAKFGLRNWGKFADAVPIARPTLNPGNPKLAHDATRGLRKYDPTLLRNKPPMGPPQLTNNRATAEQFRRAASPPGAAQSPSMAQRHAAQNAPRVNLARSGLPHRDPRTGQIIPTEQMRGEAIRRQQLALGNNL